MLACLNLRCMLLTISLSISSLDYISFCTSSKTFNLMEVTFLGADMHSSYPCHPCGPGFCALAWMTPKTPICPWQAETGLKSIAWEGLWTVILSGQASPPRQSFLNRPRKSLVYMILLSRPAPSNEYLAWRSSGQASVTEMVLDLFPSPSNLWLFLASLPLGFVSGDRIWLLQPGSKTSLEHSFPCPLVSLFLAALGKIWVQLSPGSCDVTPASVTSHGGTSFVPLWWGDLRPSRTLAQ